MGCSFIHFGCRLHRVQKDFRCNPLQLTRHHVMYTGTLHHVKLFQLSCGMPPGPSVPHSPDASMILLVGGMVPGKIWVTSRKLLCIQLSCKRHSNYETSSWSQKITPCTPMSKHVLFHQKSLSIGEMLCWSVMWLRTCNPFSLIQNTHVESQGNPCIQSFWDDIFIDIYTVYYIHIRISNWSRGKGSSLSLL